MSVQPNTFQKVYAVKETTFADSDGDFSGGIKLKPTEKISLEGVVQNIEENPTVRDDWDDVGGAPTVTTKDAKLDIGTIIAGASRTSDVVAEDALSKWLEWSIGSVDRGTANGAVSDTAGTSTTTTIYHDATLTLSVGDLVMIDGEVRRVDVVNATDSFDVDIPLSSVPADATVIYSGEVFTRDTDTTYVGVGVEMEDTEISYLFKGGVAMDLSFEAFKSKEKVKLKASYEFADWDRGTSLTASTDETPVLGAFAGVGEGLQMVDASGNYWSPCVSEVTAQLGIGYEWINDIGGTNGKCGAGAIPKDSALEMTLYQDGTLSKLEALVGSSSSIPICVQVGEEAGKVAGIYYPEAYIKTSPVATDVGALQGVKVSFMVSTGYLFRF